MNAQERRNERRAEKKRKETALENARLNVQEWAIQTGLTLREAALDLAEMNEGYLL